MNNNNSNDQFEVSRIDAENVQSAVFVFKIPHALSTDTAARIYDFWENAWRQRGHDPAPMVFVLDNDASLECLTDAKLTELGLKRL